MLPKQYNMVCDCQWELPLKSHYSRSSEGEKKAPPIIQVVLPFLVYIWKQVFWYSKMHVCRCVGGVCVYSKDLGGMFWSVLTNRGSLLLWPLGTGASSALFSDTEDLLSTQQTSALPSTPQANFFDSCSFQDGFTVSQEIQGRENCLAMPILDTVPGNTLQSKRREFKHNYILNKILLPVELSHHEFVAQ